MVVYPNFYNVKFDNEILEWYRQIHPKQIEISWEYNFSDEIEILFDLYDPSIITFNVMCITLESTEQYDKLKMLSSKAKCITVYIDKIDGEF